VWERTIEGRVLSFRLAGINNQNFIMQDRETGSWWQQVSGQAILGPLKGKQLRRVFHDELTFGEWTRELPGGRVLAPAADTAWKRFSENWEAKTAHAPVRVHASLDRRLEPRAVVFGIEANGSAKAYPLERVLEQAPLHDRLGGVPIVLLVGPDGKSVRGFEARLDGRELELVRPVNGPDGEVSDVATGSRWNFRGEAVSGSLQGRRLTPVYLLRDYWFDWMTYHPATGVYLLGN
jgi:uncharacterized protein DUF3179